MIASAVIPTMIANSFFLPAHLLPGPAPAEEAAAWPAETASNDGRGDLVQAVERAD